MKRQEEMDLRKRVEELEERNAHISEMEREWRKRNRELFFQNEELTEKCKAIKSGAHDWKVRAKAAEKRCKELLEERVKRDRSHDETMNILARYLAESDKRMLELHEEVQKMRFGREELRYELYRVKAHAYDMAFGSHMDGEDE